MANKKQMSDSFMIGAMLAIVGGFLDAYTYICRGKVFANAQTGNIVLFGIRIAEGEWVKAFYYLVPILAFVIGILLTDMIKFKYKASQRMHWRQIVVFLELVILVLVALIPQGNLNMYANILVSFVCAMQVESFRKVDGNLAATTMCTGNLRSATELLFHYVRTKEKQHLRKSLQYYGLITIFIIGACIGGVLTSLLHIKAVLVCSIILFLCFLLMFRKNRS